MLRLRPTTGVIGCVGCGHDITLLYLKKKGGKEILIFFLCLPQLLSLFFARCNKINTNYRRGVGVSLEASSFLRTVFTLEKVQSYYGK